MCTTQRYRVNLRETHRQTNKKWAEPNRTAAQPSSNESTNKNTNRVSVVCGWVGAYAVVVILIAARRLECGTTTKKQQHRLYCIKTRRGMKTERMPCAAMRYISPLSRRRE